MLPKKYYKQFFPIEARKDIIRKQLIVGKIVGMSPSETDQYERMEFMDYYNEVQRYLTKMKQQQEEMNG